MRRSVACLLTVFAAGLIVPSARGDLAPPVPKPKKIAIKVEVDENAKESRLLIPQGTVFTRPPRPIPGGPKAIPPQAEPPKVDKAELAGDEEFIVEEPRSNNLHLAIASVALALGLTFGGLWLVRKRSGHRLALLLAAGATLTAGGIVLGNAGPPRNFAKEPPPSPPANQAVAFDGEVSFEIVPGGAGPARLVLTKADYEKLKEKPTAPETKPATR